jgi:hypothetical protein
MRAQPSTSCRFARVAVAVAFAGFLDAVQAGEIAPPAELPVLPPGWSSSAALSGGVYRWSLSRGALDIGMSVEAPGRDARPFDSRFDTSRPLPATLPALSLGLRRFAAGPPTPASTLLERALGQAGAEPIVSHVGVEWKPAESQVSFLREGLGIRLDGNDRMTVRLRKGVLGIYMQRRF